MCSGFALPRMELLTVRRRMQLQCSWRPQLETRIRDTDKILANWKLHTQLWNSWKRLAKHAVSVGASLTITWAKDSRLHPLKYVQDFTARHRMVLRKVSGCVFGLKSIAKATLGRPLCKPWYI